MSIARRNTREGDIHIMLFISYLYIYIYILTNIMIRDMRLFIILDVVEA